MIRISRSISAFVATAVLHASAYAADCNMALGFRQPNDGGTRTTAVWQDCAGSALLFSDRMHVNTDGTKRSYSVADFWGEHTAINNLCNAMSDACASLSQAQLRDRRILTQQARDKGWPGDLLAATRISRQIIPLKDEKPCPEVGGYLVSATALHRPVMHDICGLDSYVDSLTVPAIVLPGRPSRNVPTGFEQHNAQIGDLAVVVSADRKTIVYSVVGDIGPPRQLGEGSVALTGALLGKTKEPENYLEIRGRPPYAGRGWDVAKAFVLIFPGTRDGNDPYMAKSRIDSDAKAALDRWGGPDRLDACARRYPNG